MFNRSKCCIIGIPDHQGIIHVGGRVGAARGPSAFRSIFLTMRGRGNPRNQVQDVGDVPGLGLDVAQNHRQASDFIRKFQSKETFSVVVGGGHDHGYSHLLGVYAALQENSSDTSPLLGCINIDAHLDVRKPAPLISSGSPFYLALESGVIHPSRFLEFGIQSHCNPPELWDYIDSKGVGVVPFNQLRQNNAVKVFKKTLKTLASRCDAIVISLDLDAIASAFSPGVSAPQAEGFTSMEVIEMMEIAGREKKTVSLGIFELNPEHDQDQRTARLAATAAYHFIESALGRK